jgi:hypothetical protein
MEPEDSLPFSQEPATGSYSESHEYSPYHLLLLGRAIAQAVSRWLPTAAVRGSSLGLVMWDLWWAKWRWGRFSPSTSVSPANFHSTNCSKNHPHLSLGLVQ